MLSKRQEAKVLEIIASTCLRLIFFVVIWTSLSCMLAYIRSSACSPRISNDYFESTIWRLLFGSLFVSASTWTVNNFCRTYSFILAGFYRCQASFYLLWQMILKVLLGPFCFLEVWVSENVEKRRVLKRANAFTLTTVVCLYRSTFWCWARCLTYTWTKWYLRLSLNLLGLRHPSSRCWYHACASILLLGNLEPHQELNWYFTLSSWLTE